MLALVICGTPSISRRTSVLSECRIPLVMRARPQQLHQLTTLSALAARTGLNVHRLHSPARQRWMPAGSCQWGDTSSRTAFSARFGSETNYICDQLMAQKKGARMYLARTHPADIGPIGNNDQKLQCSLQRHCNGTSARLLALLLARLLARIFF
jgi:hypothetical protein